MVWFQFPIFAEGAVGGTISLSWVEISSFGTRVNFAGLLVIAPPEFPTVAYEIHSYISSNLQAWIDDLPIAQSKDSQEGDDWKDIWKVNI